VHFRRPTVKLVVNRAQLWVCWNYGKESHDLSEWQQSGFRLPAHCYSRSASPGLKSVSPKCKVVTSLPLPIFVLKCRNYDLYFTQSRAQYSEKLLSAKLQKWTQRKLRILSLFLDMATKRKIRHTERKYMILVLQQCHPGIEYQANFLHSLSRLNFVTQYVIQLKSNKLEICVGQGNRLAHEMASTWAGQQEYIYLLFLHCELLKSLQWRSVTKHELGYVNNFAHKFSRSYARTVYLYFEGN
jgi:hypothetical protein